VLLSMTGYGEARLQNDNLSLVVELRAVNNRYLKIVVRATEPYNHSNSILKESFASRFAAVRFRSNCASNGRLEQPTSG